MAMKIYVASSWRNESQNSVVMKLREAGHEVYDFKVDGGFSWRHIDEDWENWTIPKYIDILRSNHIAMKGFNCDFDAMKWADACVLLLPCGRSAHLEAGYFVGANKKLFILIEQKQEPELMYAMANKIYNSISKLIEDISN